MPKEYWVILGISGLAAWISTPLLRRLAIRLDIIDHPSARKIHCRPVPYLGGLAFHVAMTASLIYLFAFIPYAVETQKIGEHSEKIALVNLYLCAAGFQLLGIWDDISPLAPVGKLFCQTILSVGMVGLGFSINQITSPFGGTIPLGWVGDVLSVLWILTIVNAVNFIDGMDGLAAGVVFFAALANLLIALHPWQNCVCISSLILMGCTLGFLPYNFSPAKIFMGDAGSLYLGALLAGTALISNVKGSTAMSLSLPLVILSLPLLDTVLAVIRRGRRNLKFFVGDREHIHHRLLHLGFSDRQVVLFVYGLCFLLSMSAVFASRLPNRYTLLFILVFLAGLLWGYIVFSAIEARIRNGQEETSNLASEKSEPSQRQ